MDPELKKLIDQLQAAHAQFREANDARIAEIEAKIAEGQASSSADPLLEEKVDKANAEITRLQAQIDAAQSRSDVVESILNRQQISGGGGNPQEAETRNSARTFYAQVRGTAINPNALQEGDIESYRKYRECFTRYLRFGDHQPDVRTAMSVGSDPDGGYWVTPDIGGRIVELIYDTSPMRQYASIETIGTDSLQGVLDLDEADAGWVGESQARPATDTPRIAQYEIPVREIYASPKATQKILDDSIRDVESWLQIKVAEKMARMENEAFVSGTGSFRPRGFLTYPHGKPTASDWATIERFPSGSSGAFAAAEPADPFLDMIYNMKSGLRAGARWFMNSLTEAKVRKLKDDEGRYLIIPDFTESLGRQLLGYEIENFETMPDVGANSLSIAFANFSQGYQIIDRTGIRVLRDPYTDKPFIVFYSTKRTGGDVVNFEAIKLMRFASSAT